MKKALILLLTLSMMLFMFAGCTSEDATPDPDNGDDPIVEEGAVSFGLGVKTSIGKSRSMADDVTAQAQVDTTFAGVSFDKDGKVVAVHIDVAQVRVAYDEEMQLTTDKAGPFLTKKDLKDNYNMKPRSDIGKEWYEQIAAFEEWMIGKTVAEIKALNVKVVDDAHQNVPDVPELTSSVTITVESYIEAVEIAWNNRTEAANIDKLGLGYTISIGKSRGAGDDVTAQAQVDVTMSATAFDADGKVVGTQIDVAQTRVAYDEEGQLTSDKSAKLKTKKELKEDYNMKARSDIGKEWYEQMAAFEDWMVGQTVAEIKGLKVKVVDDAHQNVPDVPELTSSVTITVESYIKAVENAFGTKK
ncbi:hypothetical protein HYG86_03990 [Alkalicella caledoniensis]|uniref:Chlorophenol reductase n=1 Tax=Alkalicella caledoniensis TaxID=2731377 RepID=A0A7G9W5N0_ALKCA|nr:hypothetical protein [Alkalicella caledoniensis]QNO13992.1 hypothetical protein HYG86_03990 [Alkalicella caledoniensis]